MKNKGSTLVEIIISITLISAVMIFIFGILVDLKQENKVSNTNGVSALERSSYTRVIQNDLIDDKLTGIKVCYEGQMCFKFTYQDKGEKIFKVENNEVIYGDEKWTVEDADFIKDRVQFVYKLATNEENLLLNSNANNYYLLKILIPDEDNVESNRKIDPEITNLGTGKLDIDCNEIVNYLKGASYVECDGYQFESEKEEEDLSGHTVHLQLGKRKTITGYSAGSNNLTDMSDTTQIYNSKTITLSYGQTTIRSSYGKNVSRTGDNQEIILTDVKPGETITITSTPSLSDSSGGSPNLGYTYYSNNTMRRITQFTYGIEYNQLTGVTSKNNTTYTYTFTMPRYDVYLTSELTYQASNLKTQKWEYSSTTSYWLKYSFDIMVGNPGDGPTTYGGLNDYVEAHNYEKDFQVLPQNTWLTISDDKWCGGDGDCSYITQKIKITDGGKGYCVSVKCGRKHSCRIVDHGGSNWADVVDVKKDDWDGCFNAEASTKTIMYWKDV